MTSPCASAFPAAPDDEYKKNYEYKLNVDDQKIEKIESSVEESEDPNETPIDQPYELSVIGESYIIDLATVLEFEKEKNIDDQTPLETLVKNYIGEFYNVSSDQNLVDYIYKLYDLSFNYEYIENKIIYTIKLVLR